MKEEERAEAIRLRREERLSLDEIAQQVGVSQGSLSGWLKEYPLTDEERYAKQFPNMASGRAPKRYYPYRSAVESILLDQLIETAEVSDSITSFMRLLGLPIEGGTVATMRRRLLREGVDISHFPTGRGGKQRKGYDREKATAWLFDGAKPNRSGLRVRLIALGILENCCAECRLPPFWNGKTLVLHLDHINGKADDYRLENLRLLCPNCHAQTETFGGARKRKRKEQIRP